MFGEDFWIYAIPTAVFLVTAFICQALAKLRQTQPLGWIAGLWAVFTGLMFVGAATAPGWDALIFVAALIGIAAPIGAGGLVGMGIGVARRDDIPGV